MNGHRLIQRRRTTSAYFQHLASQFIAEFNYLTHLTLALTMRLRNNPANLPRLLVLVRVCDAFYCSWQLRFICLRLRGRKTLAQ